MLNLCNYCYFPNAIKIRLVQDNLNTHNASSFYERFDAQTAYELSQKFEFHYTPLKGSWLNAAEIEFSAIARACLQRRIPTKELLEKQVLSCVNERQEKQITVCWKFSLTDARRKLNRHYVKINPENEKHKDKLI